MKIIANTYRRTFEQQNKYTMGRGGPFDLLQVLDDTQDAAFWLSRLNIKPAIMNTKMSLLSSGIKALDSHMLQQSFTEQTAKIAAGKAALLAEILKTKELDYDLGRVQTKPNIELLRDIVLIENLGSLQALWKTNVTAFQFWAEVQRLRRQV